MTSAVSTSVAAKTAAAPVVDTTRLSDGRSAEAVADLAIATLNDLLVAKNPKNLMDEKKKTIRVFKGDIDKDPEILKGINSLLQTGKFKKFVVTVVADESEWKGEILKITMSNLEKSKEVTNSLKAFKKLPDNSAIIQDMTFTCFHFDKKLRNPTPENKELSNLLFQIAPKICPSIIKKIPSGKSVIAPTNLSTVTGFIFKAIKPN